MLQQKFNSIISKGAISTNGSLSILQSTSKFSPKKIFSQKNKSSKLQTFKVKVANKEPSAFKSENQVSNHSKVANICFESPLKKLMLILLQRKKNSLHKILMNG